MLHRRPSRCVELEAADALGAIDVQVRDQLVPGLHGRLEHRVDERMHRAAVGDRERAADAVERVRAALVVLGALEVRQHVVVRPALAPELRPLVVVGAVPAQVDHRVDRARAADHAPARQVEPPVAEAGLLLAEQVPVEARLEHGRERRRDVELRRRVRAARLQQEHADVRILAQARSEHAAGRAGPDDHVVSHHSSTTSGRVPQRSLTAWM